MFHIRATFLLPSIIMFKSDLVYNLGDQKKIKGGSIYGDETIRDHATAANIVGLLVECREMQQDYMRKIYSGIQWPKTPGKIDVVEGHLQLYIRGRG